MSTEWREIRQGRLGGGEVISGYTARIGEGIGYVSSMDGGRTWQAGYQQEGDSICMLIAVCPKRSDAFLACEEAAGVAPVALSLGI
ncbi:MAG: hypothetical protein Q8O76_01390 [Chloroflexota bacterium]|nr:hypothetical protein [Chloroflexota bacterium]